ncbi:transporter substrate-binding domain-containing protein, partial [Fusobacterium mortiferum]|uniref:transporter substrate-binding domain-containing protein n=1 Tax=Fusobacterium mortiferum TaxID=850 RepID=UPI0019573003|nr:transporter substrate-binding domain-containing protein [Fusobacterium mortiferum]
LYADLNDYEEIRKEYKKLKVLVPNRNCIPYYKEKRFKKIGIVPFIMKNVENFLGIPVEYVFSEDEDWDINAVDFSNNDKTISKEYYRAKIVGINHIYDNKITNYDQLDDLRIIKLKGVNLDTLLKKVKTKEIIEVDSLKEAFKLLKDREGDILIGPYFLLNSYMNTYNYNKYFKLSLSQFEVVIDSKGEIELAPKEYD